MAWGFWNKVKKGFQKLGGAIKTGAQKVKEFGGKVLSTAKPLLNTVGNVAGAAANIIGGKTGAALNTISNVADVASDVADDLNTSVQSGNIGNLANSFKRGGQTLYKAGSQAYNDLRSNFRGR